MTLLSIAKTSFNAVAYENFSSGQIILKPIFGWIFASILLTVILLFALKEFIYFDLKILKNNNLKGISRYKISFTKSNLTNETVGMRIRRFVICILLSICVLCPCVMRNTIHRSLSATNVLFVLDVTGSMKVKDAGYASYKNIERIQTAKLIINKVTKSYPNASFAGIRFGTSTSVDVPLTPDANAIENWVNTVQTEPTGISSGTSLDAPIDQTLLTAKAIRDSHPEDVNVLYLISDGEETTARKRRTFSSLRAYINHAFVITVGSKEGGKIPVSKDTLEDSDNSDTSDSADDSSSDSSSASSKSSSSWVIDPSTGNPGISKTDDKNMKNIADELSGGFIHAKYSQEIGNEAKSIMSKQWRDSKTFKPRLRPEPIVWPFALVLSFVMLWELSVWLLTSRKLI